jgi:spore coat-associated protein N
VLSGKLTMPQTLAPAPSQSTDHAACQDCLSLAVLLGAAPDACYHADLGEDEWERVVAQPATWPRRRERLRRLSATAAVLLLTGFLAGFGTWAAFSGATDNEDNVFASGTVKLASNDSDTRMFNVENMKPGQSEEQCIVVTYIGTLESNVRLYGTSGGDGLADHLNLKVWRAPAPTTPVPFPECPAGGPGMQLYDGSVSDLPDGWDLGTGGILTWMPDDAHVYRVRVELPETASGDEVQGLSATLRLVWEARNT